MLKITYGQTSFLFTGDAQREAEAKILEKYESDLDADVLKVSHHGGDNATSYPFLRAIMPEIAVISVGSGNSYGHPTDNTLSRLRDADAKVYRTDMQGDIYCESDGKKVSVTTQKNSNADTFTAPTTNTSVPDKDGSSFDSGTDTSSSSFKYVLNTSTKKIHLPSCRHVSSIASKNYAETNESKEELEKKGYTPCGTCKP